MKIKVISITIISFFFGQLMGVNVDIREGYTKISQSDSINKVVDDLLAKENKVEAMKLASEKCKELLEYGEYVEALILLDKAIIGSNYGRDTIQHPIIKNLYMECLNLKGASYNYLANYDDAISCFIALDKYNKGGDAVFKAKFYNGMGGAFAMNRKTEQAGEYYRLSINSLNNIDDERERIRQRFSVYSNIAGLFVSKSEFDSAQIYLMDIQKMAVSMKDKKKEVVSLQLFGYLNSYINKHKLAMGYYEDAYKLAIENRLYYAMPFIKLNIAICYTELNDYDNALVAANQALEMAQMDKLKKTESAILEILSSIYAHKGNHTKAYSYLLKSKSLKDSVFSQENEARLMQQKQNFDLYQVQMEKEILNRDLEIEKGKRFTTNLIAFFAIIVFFGMSIWVTYRLYVQYKLNMKLNRQHFEDINVMIDEKKTFEDEISKKNMDISKYTILAVEINEAKNTLLSKLKVIKSNLPSNNKGYDTIKEMEEILQGIQVAESHELKELNHYFDQVSSDFYYKLECRYPDLTLSERKMCALISLGLSQKEMLILTGKTSSAISNAKLRIKKKINIDVNMDLREFLSRM